MKALVRFLRSPRLAVGLALGIAAYSVIGTMVPQMDLDPAKAAAWHASHPALAGIARVLGLFSAFSSPVFLGAVALLAASAVSCAWARTRMSGRILKWQRGPFPQVEALAKRPGLATGPVRGRSEADLLDSAESALRRAGLRVVRRDRVLHAAQGTWGALGSPVFHWSLVLLVIAIAAGQMTRAEGRLPIPVDGRVVDAAENYSGRIEQGPLFPGHTGLTLAARDLRMKTIVDGIDRGATAVMGIYRGSNLLAERRVYPNSPLRHGALLIHPDTWGYAPLFSVEATSGEVLAEAHGYIPVSEVTSQGAGPGVLGLDGSTVGVRIGFVIPARTPGPPESIELTPAVSVAVRRGEESTSTPVLLGEGERTPLQDGLWLRFVGRGEFVRVAIANDWSVPWIYALFVLAAGGLSVALFVRPRGAWVFEEETPEGTMLRVVPRRSREDPLFEERLASVLSREAHSGASKEEAE